LDGEEALTVRPSNAPFSEMLEFLSLAIQSTTKNAMQKDIRLHGVLIFGGFEEKPVISFRRLSRLLPTLLYFLNFSF